MKNLAQFTSAILTILFTFSFTAQAAGPGNGGGGGAYVWRDGVTGKIVRAELMDLYIYQHDTDLRLKYRLSDEPVETQLEKMLNYLRETRQSDLLNAFGLVETKMRFLEFGVRIPLSPDNDPFSTKIPQLAPDPNVCKQQGLTCAPEMIAYYDGRGFLQVNPEIYGALPETHKLAFKAHEAFYKIFRTLDKDTDAVKTRLAVATFFSDSNPQWPIHRSVPDTYFTLFPTWDERQSNTAFRALSIDVIELIWGDKTLTCRPKKPSKKFNETVTFKMGTRTFDGLTETTLLQNNEFTHNGYRVSWGQLPKSSFSSSPIIEISTMAHWSGWTYKMNLEQLLAARMAGEEKREIPGFFVGKFSSEAPGAGEHKIVTQEINESVICKLQ